MALSAPQANKRYLNAVYKAILLQTGKVYRLTEVYLNGSLRPISVELSRNGL